MKIHYLPLWAILLGLLFSCEKEEEQPFSNPTQINDYFLLKQLVEEQISLLDQKQVEKRSVVNGEKRVEKVRLEEEDWRKELDIFIQADINKASLSTSYDTEKSKDRLVHRLKPGNRGEIKEIIVVFEDGSENVKSVEFFSERENLFYTSKARGILDFKGEVLEAYQVEGFQKVWFLPPNKLEIQGRISP